ncbi:DNA repair protein RadC [Odoribacter sp. AF15-53]|uniref:RadC family protein n=1 Tax=Odoribacter sp. AF15-53 TaxID=2292236 RepID=UPI000E550CA1|nr:DNA repair protein RadC [Odoribacter sp. AF15-53]RHR77658.1 DNA repair protein RadC [Odoribacter sp. AF15-53]
MADNYIPISSWAEDDKPREKMLLKGVASLSVNELLAILLRSGSGGESALDLARRILADSNNDLNLLARLSVSDFMSRYKGVGMAKAASIIAAMELGRRRALSTVREEPMLTTSRDLYDYLQPLIGDLDHEEFWVMTLSSACRIKSCERLFSGGIESTIIDIRMVFRKVLESKACSVVIAHNHPSGNDRPSAQDIVLTKKVREAGKVLDIVLLDHIIVCPDRYYSFADSGML